MKPRGKKTLDEAEARVPGIASSELKLERMANKVIKQTKEVQQKRKTFIVAMGRAEEEFRKLLTKRDQSREDEIDMNKLLTQFFDTYENTPQGNGKRTICENLTKQMKLLLSPDEEANETAHKTMKRIAKLLLSDVCILCPENEKEDEEGQGLRRNN